MKKIVCLLFILISLIGFGVKAEENFDVSAKHAIAVEANTGKILYEKDADTTAGIASITKMLTVYMVYRKLNLVISPGLARLRFLTILIV